MSFPPKGKTRWGSHDRMDFSSFFGVAKCLSDFVDCLRVVRPSNEQLELAGEFFDRVFGPSSRNGLLVSDIALLLYHFHTHRQIPEDNERNLQETGYTGVLQDLVKNIDRDGKERLERKLSVDFNELIPFVVDGPWHKAMLQDEIRRHAVRYDIDLIMDEDFLQTRKAAEPPRPCTSERLGGLWILCLVTTSTS